MVLKSFWRVLTQSDKQGSNLTEYRHFLSAHWACICGAASHFLLIFVFLYIGLNIMAYVNIVSVGIFLFGLYLVHKHSNFLLTSVLAAFEVNAHAGLAIYFLGWDAGFQYFIFAVVVGAFFFKHRKVSIYLALFSIFNFLILFLLFAARTPPFYASDTIINFFHISIGFTALIIVFVFASVFSRAVNETEALLKIQFDRAESLLRNILPATVAERLKEKQELIADGFGQVSILFADIQNFTELSDTLKPDDLVYFLNNYFSLFDDLLEPYGMEKIKTIGDAYMVACGCPDHCHNHAENTVGFAMAMLSATRVFNQNHNMNFSLRIGINSGPVIAGIIGKKKYVYDLWGDTVNVASRMETSGAPGKIHITENTFQLIKDKYSVTKRDPIQIKGKGLMQTYFINPEFKTPKKMLAADSLIMKQEC